MAAEAQRAPRVACGRKSLAAAHERAWRQPTTRMRQWWAEVQPGLSIDRNNCIERWDGQGEGRASAVSFEGFGITGIIFVGRTPKAVRS